MEPLKHPERQIRLLHLLPGNEKATDCTVTVHDLDSAPDYLAISYTWGDTENSRQIYIDKVPHHVRGNSHYALWQARLHYPSAPFWIDAICITQNDLKEKGFQVAMMGRIYSKAAHVVACVGSGNDDVDFMVHFSPDLVHTALHPADKSKYGPAVLDDSLYNSTSMSCENLWERLKEEKSELEMVRFLRVYENFIERPYWQRVWIMQEIFMARSITVLCGRFQLPWTFIENLNILSALTDISSEYSWLSFTTLPRLSRLGRSSETLSAIPADEFLDLLCTAKCADKRDRIYGTLALLTWDGSRLPLVPDYQVSAFKLAIAVIQRWTIEGIDGDNFYILCLLNALGIDKSNADVMHLVQNRCLSNYLIPSSEQKWTYQMNCRSTGLRVDTKGRLTCCLDKKRERVEPYETELNEMVVAASTNSISPLEDWQICKQRLLYVGDIVAAVACSGVCAGDLLAAINQRTWLILRRHQQQTFRIIGQAIILAPFKICDKSKGCPCTCAEYGLKHDVLLQKSFGSTLDLVDILVLMAQDKVEGFPDVYEFDPGERIQRLVTRVSKYSNPTITLVAGEEQGVETTVVEANRTDSTQMAK